MVISKRPVVLDVRLHVVLGILSCIAGNTISYFFLPHQPIKEKWPDVLSDCTLTSPMCHVLSE